MMFHHLLDILFLEIHFDVFCNCRLVLQQLLNCVNYFIFELHFSPFYVYFFGKDLALIYVSLEGVDFSELGVFNIGALFFDTKLCYAAKVAILLLTRWKSKNIGFWFLIMRKRHFFVAIWTITFQLFLILEKWLSLESLLSLVVFRELNI